MSPRGALRRGFDLLETLCARVMGPGWNPLVQLGALGWFFFWIVAVSGIYLYIFFDTGITGTYESIEAISRDQWWAGGILRSLHRYASIALLVTAIVHMLREYAGDRIRGNHWFAWVTGLPLLLFIFVCGITGYWLVWDALAQFVAQTTSEVLDVLPIFGEPIARNFLNQASLSDRFFSLMVLIHIAAPLLMLLFMWVHISRHSRARVNPARGLGAAVLGVLVALSLVHPALSQPPADLDTVPATVGLDWFYLGAYPSVVNEGGEIVLWASAAVILLLFLLPWLPPARNPPVATVSLPDCNGCGRCYVDCPFDAIALGPRSDGLAYLQEAVVDADKCMSCGICVGACPTATPFRSAQDFSAGIELPSLKLTALRRELHEAAERMTGEARLIVFDCGRGAALPSERGGSAATIRVPCVGMVPPPVVDYVLTRKLADGVVFAGCAEDACFFRLGDRLTAERIAGLRDPRLRERIPRSRVAVSWAGRGQRSERVADVAAFAAGLRALPPMTRGAGSGFAPATRRAPDGWPAPLRWAGRVALLAALALPVGIFAGWPAWRQLPPDHAVIRLSFTHAAKPIVECPKLTAAEMAELKPNMRRAVGCPRARWPVSVELLLDGELLYRGRHEPAGIWDDGPSTVFESFVAPAGRHTLAVKLRDTGRATGFDYAKTIGVDLAEAQNFVIEFRANEGFSFR
jgi:ferredoxin/coenzyme F420-reducing hydrogenase delta subunit